MNKNVDLFGTELNIGDYICFTIKMRINQYPIVKAKIGSFEKDFIIIDRYVDSSDVKWAEEENKLIKKVKINRVVKCY